VFKGSGFYKTDSRKAGGDGAVSTPSSSAPAPAKSSSDGASTPTTAGKAGE
jgi:hypothetical protein